MSGDNGKIIGEGQAPSEGQKPKDIVLFITLSREDGQIQVQGPGNGKLFDEPMCFYLLEKAKDFIKHSNAKALQPKMVIPNASMAQQARRFFNK